jgi:hypothetical protein
VSFQYLASPYSRYPAGIDAAHRDACRAAAYLIRRGVHVFCPIAHTHPIALHGALDPRNHDLWLALDRKMMDAAAGLIVVMMEGWDTSVGIRHEMTVFANARKPISYLDWPLPERIVNIERKEDRT